MLELFWCILFLIFFVVLLIRAFVLCLLSFLFFFYFFCFFPCFTDHRSGHNLWCRVVISEGESRFWIWFCEIICCLTVRELWLIMDKCGLRGRCHNSWFVLEGRLVSCEYNCGMWVMNLFYKLTNYILSWRSLIDWGVKTVSRNFLSL